MLRTIRNMWCLEGVSASLGCVALPLLALLCYVRSLKSGHVSFLEINTPDYNYVQTLYTNFEK